MTGVWEKAQKTQRVHRHKKSEKCICLAMDQHVKNIFYLGMTEENQGCVRAKRREPLPVFRDERGYAFLKGPEGKGKNRNEAGALRIYFALLPFGLQEEMKKKRLKKRWIGKIAGALEFAEESLGIKEENVVFSGRLCRLFERSQTLPWELYAVRLRTCRQEEAFRHMNLSIPEECGGEKLEEAVRLLAPYLPRINSVVMVGEETESAWRIEDYLYDEYGIVTSYAKRPEQNVPWLDLSGKDGAACVCLSSGKEICHINDAEVLNFLDTSVKSGYNTKVN